MTARAFGHIFGQLDQTGDRMTEDLEHLFDLGLVLDAAVSLSQARAHGPALRELQRRGGLVALSVYPSHFDAACRDSNWWAYSAAECERLLRLAADRFADLDLGPLTATCTYTPGNTYVTACRRVGIRYNLGFCAPMVGEDGGWRIAHYGSPLSPYFIADDDFRKPEEPGERPDPVAMVNMELRNPLTCLYHWNEGPWCPLNAQAADRWLEPGGEPLPFLAIAEDWLRQTELTGVPRFFHLNLQYFFAGRCREHNRRALAWLSDQRDRGRLEVGGIQTWVERMRAAGGLPRQTTYWRGEMMGFHVGHRPGSVADTIVDEQPRRQAIWQYPDAAPRRWYDYTRRWDYPPFAPRGDAPVSEESTDITAATELLAETGTTRRWRVTIANTGQPRTVPLVLWETLDNTAGPYAVVAPTGWTAEVVPHPAGVGGALLLEGPCAAGETALELRVEFGRHAANRHRRRYGHLLEAQTFRHDHRPYTVVASQAPERFEVTARVARGPNTEPIRVESLCGLDYQARTLPASGLTLAFDGGRLANWHRFWGVQADELELDGVAETEARLRETTAMTVRRLAPGLKVPAPGYQRFGNLTDRSRWDRVLGKAAGEAERSRMNAWFRAQRPAAGEVVIEVHPGIGLPRGSITKVLGHEFDWIHCSPGYEFEELAADYPQGWDWGVTAWVMWRWLTVAIGGLRPEDAPYTLHLHAFDPESRDTSLRVHAYDRQAAERLEVCLVRDWELPRGLEGRWQPQALCSIPLPAACLTWSSLALWICPTEKIKLYDWIAERGSPGLFSHLWVTRAAAAGPAEGTRQ